VYQLLEKQQKYLLGFVKILPFSSKVISTLRSISDFDTYIHIHKTTGCFVDQQPTDLFHFDILIPDRFPTTAQLCEGE
jgi:hypothetical protein